MSDVQQQGKPITLRLSSEVVPATQFRAAVDAFIEMLTEVANSYALEIKAKEKLEWGISVREGSALINAIPSAKDALLAPAVVHLVASGLAEIERGGERPPNFTDKALNAVRTLSRLSSDEMEVRLTSVGTQTVLSENSVETVSNVLDARYSDYGSLDGYMQVISTRGKIKATLFEDLTDRAISCNFEDFESSVLDELFRAMRNRRRVEVSGLIAYRSDGQPIKIAVENFEIFPHSDELPSIRSIVGILKDKN